MRRVLALGICLAVPVFAQQPPQPPTFRTSIDLVQVDVVVVDKDGNAIRGLKAADFALTDRNKPQMVVAFEEISHERAAASGPALPPMVRKDVASNRTAQSDRLVVMVVDDLHIFKGRTDRAKEIARRVVGDLGPEASMAVLFTSGDHSTQVTGDRSRLHTAIETLRGRQSWRRPHQAIDKQRADGIDPEDSMESALAKIQKAQDTNLQDFFDNLTQYKTLQDAARMLGAGDARRKAFVLVSEGIGKNLTGLFGAMAPSGDAPAGGVAYATTGDAANTMRPPPTEYHDFALLDMMESLRRSNVATYAIDPRGHIASADLARECVPPPLGKDPCSEGLTDWNSPVRQAQHGLEIMSEASGGFAVTNTDDFTSGLKRIVEDLDHYYLLGFYPADPKGKGYRPIDVKVPGHPDWTLRFRRGYMPGAPPAAPKNSNPLVALSAGILPKSDLPLRLAAVPFPGAGRNARIALALEVSAPLHALQEADSKVRDSLKYEVLVVDEKKARVSSVAGLEGRLTLSPNATGRPIPDVVSYQVAHTIDLPPGRYQLRVSAISTKLAKGGSVYLDVDVPDFQAAPLALSGLILGYADGPRVPVAPARTRPAVSSAPQSRMIGRPGLTAMEPPVIRTVDAPFPPSLDREFASADTLRLYFEVSAPVSARPLRGMVQVLDARNRAVQSYSPAFSPRGRVDLQIPLAGLSPGTYVVRATATDEANTSTREIGFVVR